MSLGSTQPANWRNHLMGSPSKGRSDDKYADA
jgi:hypothetical protein